MNEVSWGRPGSEQVKDEPKQDGSALAAMDLDEPEPFHITEPLIDPLLSFLLGLMLGAGGIAYWINLA